MKKILIFTLVAAIFIACKKDKNTPTPTLPDVTGNWTLYSATISGGPSGTTMTYKADDHPCLVDNIFSINKNGTTEAYYTGNTACNVDVNQAQQYTLTIGMPGQDTTHGTWSSNADVFVLKYGNSYSYGKVNSVNGKEQLTLVDTLNALGKQVYTNIFIRQ